MIPPAPQVPGSGDAADSAAPGHDDPAGHARTPVRPGAAAPPPSGLVTDASSPSAAAEGAPSPSAVPENASPPSGPTADAPSPSAVAEGALARDGYAFAPAEAMRAMLDADALAHWDGFAASWNHLGIDRYMADGGRYRRRRHAVFSVGRRGIERKPHQPHYQSRDYNALNGGVERWFTPVEDAIATHPVLRSVLETCRRMFDALTPPGQRPDAWHVELHQFRIEPSDGEDGQPTPEGLHRDGVDWVLVLLVSRENIERGVTTIHDLRRRQLGAFTLAQPLDAALVDDGRVYHGVTAVRPLDPSLPSHRDVLVVTFRRQ